MKSIPKSSRNRVILLISLIAIFAMIYSISQTINQNFITGASTAAIESYIEDTGNISLYFCPRDNCEEKLNELLNSATESINCAFYELDLPSVKATLLARAKEIPVKIVTDNEYLKEFNNSLTTADKSGLMHNKFCIIDRRIISTGSMNPTDNDGHKNNNNLLIIHSTVLAQNYLQEFAELQNGTFKKGSPVVNPSIIIGNSKIRTYFCPDDGCVYHIKKELQKAQHSIYFMTFSFTHDGIGNELLLKHLDNLTIKGVMEKRQIEDESEYYRLEKSGIALLKDGNNRTMHHKVFIIDSETVITGSMNPTTNGDRRNDENVLIIKDRAIAEQFLAEFERVWEVAGG